MNYSSSGVKLAFKRESLKKLEVQEILSSIGPLGPDPSSKYFARRTKNIAYVMNLEGQWFQLHADYLIQSHQYNDFSGGYRRSYQEMPSTFLQSPATQKVLTQFQQAFDIPPKEPVLVQVQRSHINRHNVDRCLTGQGIHSDGANQAMLLCLERHNINGAKNAIYHDLKGDFTLMRPFVLNEGEVLFWQDNKVFHHVSTAQLMNPNANGQRTVMIAHYPATQYLSGRVNPRNLLGAKRVAKEKRLRLQQS